MNLSHITDVLQCVCLVLLSITGIRQNQQIKELQEFAAAATGALISTRKELELPLFPPEPEEEDEG